MMAAQKQGKGLNSKYTFEGKYRNRDNTDKCKKVWAVWKECIRYTLIITADSGWLKMMLTELLIFVSFSAEGADHEGSELNEQLHSSSCHHPANSPGTYLCSFSYCIQSDYSRHQSVLVSGLALQRTCETVSSLKFLELFLVVQFYSFLFCVCVCFIPTITTIMIIHIIHLIIQFIFKVFHRQNVTIKVE